jgi:activator of HSP90 ATPase
MAAKRTKKAKAGKARGGTAKMAAAKKTRSKAKAGATAKKAAKGMAKPKPAAKTKSKTKTKSKAKLKANTKGAVKVKTFRQLVEFAASPAQVYGLLMDAKKHAAFTESEVKIVPVVGGAFSAYDGFCFGTFLELVEDRKIVQSWSATDWPKGHFSTVEYALAPASGGTLLTFTQTGVPEKAFAEMDSAWIEHYWQPMQKMLAG